MRSDHSGRTRLPATIAIAALAAAAGVSGAEERLIIAQVPTKEVGSISAAPGYWACAPPAARSRIVLFDPSSPGRRVTNLTSDFESAGRPDISFDGRRILFVGRRERGDLSQVWEMELDGGEVRRITEVGFHVLDAIYLSTIYTIDAVEPVLQIAFIGISDDSPQGAMYTCRMDGTRVRRITFGPGTSQLACKVSDPYQLSDGRLVFTRWTGASTTSSGAEPVDTSLMTIHVDGTGLFPFAAVHERPGVRSVSCEMPDGRVIYAETPHDANGRWSLISVARTRSLHTRRLVADEPAGSYVAASPLSEDSLLVSYRPRGRDSTGIYQLDLHGGRAPAEVHDDPEWDEVDVAIVRPRRMPDGRSSVVDYRVDYGYLYGLNVYLSDRKEGEHIAAGRIDRLRVFRAVLDADPTSDGATGGSRKPGASKPVAEELLGEVPIEPDGSFYLRVPARAPLRLQTIDADGNVLQSMRSYIWVMPMESRGCIGCHADRELTPPNRHVRALRKAPHEIGVEPGRNRKPLSRHAYDPEATK